MYITNTWIFKRDVLLNYVTLCIKREQLDQSCYSRIFRDKVDSLIGVVERNDYLKRERKKKEHGETCFSQLWLISFPFM